MPNVFQQKDKNNSSILEILESLKKSAELTLFFKKLWENELMARLFFAHKDLLFLQIEEGQIRIMMPYLAVDNLPPNLSEIDPTGLRVLVSTSELREIGQQKAMDAYTGVLEGAMNDIRDVLMYFLIKFVRKNKDIQKGIRSKEFSFEKMKEILKDYKGINLDAFDELKCLDEKYLDDIQDEDISNETDSNEIKRMIKKYALGFTNFIKSSNLFELLEQMNLTNIFTPCYLYGYDHTRNLLSVQQIQANEYRAILFELYTLKLIDNLGTVFWCMHCQDEPFICTTTSRISPTHLKMMCPKCDKPVAIGTVYDVHPTIKESILHQDGLLSVALAWLLKERDIKFEPSICSSEYENDFLCETPNGKVLIECRMHMTDRDKRSVEGTIKQDLDQIIKHIKTLKNDGIKILRGYFVCNYDLENYSDIIEEVVYKSKFTGDVKKYSIQIIGYNDVPRVVDELSKR